MDIYTHNSFIIGSELQALRAGTFLDAPFSSLSRKSVTCFELIEQLGILGAGHSSARLEKSSARVEQSRSAHTLNCTRYIP